MSETEKQAAQPSLSNYFTPFQWVLFFTVLITGLLSRWLFLDMRPYHHDESLHGMYGRYFFDFPEAHYYKYDPMLHGPMLYNTMRFIYSAFGSSDFAARIPVAFMGSIFMLMPLLFRRFLTPVTVLILTAVVSLSPTLVYWARFLREDSWVISFLLIALYGVSMAPKRWKASLVILSFTLQWCTKANVLVTLAILFGYLVFEFAFRRLVLKENGSLIEDLAASLTSHPKETSFGIAVSTLIYCWFFSAGFRYADGPLQGLYKGAEYWWDQNGKERIEGPFMFHVYQLGWYELPFLIAFFVQLGMLIRSTSKPIKGGYLASLLLCIIALGIHSNGTPIQDFFLWKILKLKDLLDVACFFLLFCNSLLLTIHHLGRREYQLSFFGYLFTATFFTYSYLGEKVPWLSVYPFITGLIYLTLYFQDYFRKHPFDAKNFSLGKFLGMIGILCFVLGVIFIIEDPREFTMSFAKDSKFGENCYWVIGGLLLILLWVTHHLAPFLGTVNLWVILPAFVSFYLFRSMIQTNFVYAGKDNEFISQVHSTYEVAEAAKRIKAEILFEQSAYRPKVLATGESTWPLTWYFRDLPEYKFTATEAEKKDFTYIFQDWKDEPKPGDIPEGFYVRKLNLRGWWVPDRGQMTLKKYLNYSLNHTPWSGTGFSYVTLLTAKETGRFKEGK